MDIFEITRSKLRTELLRLYLLRPGSRYYLRELERKLGLPVANIRRELKKLERMGLFKCEKAGNLSYYLLNKEFSLYPEIRNIIIKTAGLGDVFRKYLAKIDGIEYAFIYGSFAKGEEIAASDVDLMLIGTFSYEQLLPALRKIEDRIGKTVNPVSFSHQELEDRIKKNNHFIRKVLKSDKMMIIGNEDELSRIRKK